QDAREDDGGPPDEVAAGLLGRDQRPAGAVRQAHLYRLYTFLLYLSASLDVPASRRDQAQVIVATTWETSRCTMPWSSTRSSAAAPALSKRRAATCGSSATTSTRWRPSSPGSSWSVRRGPACPSRRACGRCCSR